MMNKRSAEAVFFSCLAPVAMVARKNFFVKSILLFADIKALKFFYKFYFKISLIYLLFYNYLLLLKL